MRHKWLLVGGCAAIAVSVGFQRAEPLEELRKYGSLYRGIGHVGPDGYSFVPAEMAAERFVESLAVLSRCESVRELVVPKMANLDKTLGCVAKLSHVVSLSLFNQDVTDGDLVGLAGMKQLEFLELSHNPRVTDAGVAALSGLGKLRYLDLGNTKVSGTGLKDRADMVSLYQLTLTDCPVTDESLAVIPRFPKLEELLIGGTNVTDKGLMNLVGWHSLRRVDRTRFTTKAGSIIFNDTFLAARRKARDAGVLMDPRDIPPVFLDNWRE